MGCPRRLHLGLRSAVVFQLIPKVALAPIFLLWFGTGFAANMLFSVFIAFFPVVVATIAGLQAAPPNYERLCRSLMMSRMRMFLTVKFPFALPHILSGLRIGVTFAVIGVVLGEFITAQTGLGYILLFAANNFETALLLAGIVLLCGVGSVLFGFSWRWKRWSIVCMTAAEAKSPGAASAVRPCRRAAFSRPRSRAWLRRRQLGTNP